MDFVSNQSERLRVRLQCRVILGKHHLLLLHSWRRYGRMQSLHGNQFVQLSVSMDRLLGIQQLWERSIGPDLLQSRRQPASLRFSEPFRTVLRCTSSFERLKLRAPLLFFFFKMEEEGWRAAGVPIHVLFNSTARARRPTRARWNQVPTHQRSSVDR
jgi:hypothetical protein